VCPRSHALVWGTERIQGHWRGRHLMPRRQPACFDNDVAPASFMERTKFGLKKSLSREVLSDRGSGL
jgi:hypothetical protein